MFDKKKKKTIIKSFAKFLTFWQNKQHELRKDKRYGGNSGVSDNSENSRKKTNLIYNLYFAQKINIILSINQIKYGN